MHEHNFVHNGYMHGVRTYECRTCGAFAADADVETETPNV